MRFVDEFRDQKIAQGILKKICRLPARTLSLMEVCGTHTVAFFRHGLRTMLPKHIRLVSGPGCPVCVTPNHDVDLALTLARQKGLIITTFGDMMRVPGSASSLQREKAEGKDIRIIYSPMESLRIARENPGKRVVFLAIGFETTSPGIAVTVARCKEEGINNLFFLNSQKRIPAAIDTLIGSGKVAIDGFILPGHVSTVIGTLPYRFIAEKHGLAAVITGFEPLDLLQGLWTLLRLIHENRAEVVNAYKRVVTDRGNPVAVSKIAEVFAPDSAEWRGIGRIPDSGYRFREEYESLDVLTLGVTAEPSREHPGCLCGEVLQGIKTPLECPLFREKCDPERPVGPCMVSAEGTCATYFKYRRALTVMRRQFHAR